MPSRFLTLDDLAAELTVSRSQAYALVRDGTVPAMQVGGRHQWRIERTRLEQWIQDSHADTAGSIPEPSQPTAPTLRRRVRTPAPAALNVPG